MILRNIIYDIREKLKISSDDMDMTDAYFAHLVDTARITLTKQRFTKFSRNIPEETKQIISVPLSKVKDCDVSPIYKSDIIIPATMEIGGRSGILSVRVKDLSITHLNIVPIERFPYVGNNKWIQNQTYVALDADNTLYFKHQKANNPILLEEAFVIGVFTDPAKADMYSPNYDDSIHFYDKEYPVEGYLIKSIVDMIVKDLSATLQLPEDNINNADESNRN